VPFEVELSELAAAKFKKLDAPVRKRIGTALQRAAANPARHFKRLTGVQAYTLRVGDWRVIADIDVDREVIHVLTLGHRSTIYG
jgi:mRNA interferase RelE/StbE